MQMQEEHMPRRHDDAHRPVQGIRKARGATALAGRPLNFGAGELLTAPVCVTCGVMKLRIAGAWSCKGCDKAVSSSTGPALNGGTA